MSVALLGKEFETDKSYISVITTSYNRKEFILDAVNSVSNQLLERSKYGIIVVKNYLDNTIDKFLKEHNIIDIYTDDIPIGKMIVYGTNKSSAEVLCFLDDDLFLPNKLETIYSVIKKNQNIRNIYLYESPSTKNFLPTVFYNISSVFEKKLKSLSYFESHKGKIYLDETQIKDHSYAYSWKLRGVRNPYEAFVVYMSIR